MTTVSYPRYDLGPTGPAGPTGGVGPAGAAATLPQGLAATDSPTFVGLTLSAPGSGAGTTMVRTAGGVVLDLTSTRATKENIRPMRDVVDPAVLMSLEPVAYNYVGQDPVEDVSFGFIAEDVDAVCQPFVIYRDGAPYSLQYSEFIPLIVAGLKEHENRFTDAQSDLSAAFEALARAKSSNESLSEDVAEVKSRCARSEALARALAETTASQTAKQSAFVSHVASQVGAEQKAAQKQIDALTEKQALIFKLSLAGLSGWVILIGVLTWMGVAS